MSDSSEADSHRQCRMARLDLRAVVCAFNCAESGVGVGLGIEVQIERRIGITGVEVIEGIESLKPDLQHPAFTPPESKLLG
jgi:hypothetical protein